MAVRGSRGVTRRLVLLGALLPVTAWLPLRQGGDASPRGIAYWLRVLMPDAGAADLGAHYLRAFPGERSADHLAQELFGCSLSDETDRPGVERLMHRVRESRARDFRDDDLVLLDGWVVPRTEARLLALLACCEAR
jgi:hypothetical protein